MDESNELVLVVFLQGDDYQSAIDSANDLGGSFDAVVEVLAQWDTGDELDQASQINGTTHVSWVESLAHVTVEHGGLTYWLNFDHKIGTYALYRKVLETVTR